MISLVVEFHLTKPELRLIDGICPFCDQKLATDWISRAPFSSALPMVFPMVTYCMPVLDSGATC